MRCRHAASVFETTAFLRLLATMFPCFWQVRKALGASFPVDVTEYNTLAGSSFEKTTQTMDNAQQVPFYICCLLSFMLLLMFFRAFAAASCVCSRKSDGTSGSSIVVVTAVAAAWRPDYHQGTAHTQRSVTSQSADFGDIAAYLLPLASRSLVFRRLRRAEEWAAVRREHRLAEEHW